MAPNRRCPFGLSDHLTITIFPAIRQKSVSEKRIIKVCDKRRSNISSFGRFFQNVPFEDILSSVQSPCEKLTIFTDTINYGLNTIMPERSIKVHVIDRPWMTNNVKRLINKDRRHLQRVTNLCFHSYEIKSIVKENDAVRYIIKLKCRISKILSLFNGGVK